jgi:hypothetical protein
MRLLSSAAAQLRLNQDMTGIEHVVYEPSQIGRIWVHSFPPGGGCLLLDENKNEIILGKHAQPRYK